MSGKPADVGCGPRLGAVGDANYIANTGVATVQYGPGGIAEYEQWPAINERIKIEDLLVGARTMSLTAAEICGV
jgi:acetylornithine deacetylase/succinyl-diaminopimelate desuccinylase-like protein